MTFYSPFSSTWIHPASVAALAVGALLVLLLVGWAVARARRPPPCDEQESSRPGAP